jgi:tRNA threonylcarbamoyladenosine biosynthesis protein TsaB
VRIACGLTQGLALGLGKPVVPVETQMALAEQAGMDKVLVALDARMGEIYLAAYQQSADEPSGWVARIAPCLCKLQSLPGLADGGWSGIGSAFTAPALGEALAQRYGTQLVATGRGALPSAADVARIAVRRLQRDGFGSALPPAQAAPLYLRNKVAMTIEERRVLKEQKEQKQAEQKQAGVVV